MDESERPGERRRMALAQMAGRARRVVGRASALEGSHQDPPLPPPPPPPPPPPRRDFLSGAPEPCSRREGPGGSFPTRPVNTI